MRQSTSQKHASGRAVPGALAYLALLAASWAFLLAGAGLGMSMRAMSTFRFPPPIPPDARIEIWSPEYAVTMTVMWWIMMVAMMLPGIAGAPEWKSFEWKTLLNGGRVPDTHQASAAVSFRFCLGYLLPWLAFSLFATALQYGLEQHGLLHGRMMWSVNTSLSAGILAGVGLYQMSRFKQYATNTCRSAGGRRSSLREGLGTGFACIISTGPLMMLLFVGGTMNLVWIVALTVITWLEKQVSNPHPVSRIVGVVCLLAAAYSIASG